MGLLIKFDVNIKLHLSKSKIGETFSSFEVNSILTVNDFLPGKFKGSDDRNGTNHFKPPPISDKPIL
jgi:hypothetical protein